EEYLKSSLREREGEGAITRLSFSNVWLAGDRTLREKEEKGKEETARGEWERSDARGEKTGAKRFLSQLLNGRLLRGYNRFMVIPSTKFPRWNPR
ncbi:hypothetical protein X777_08337, partial [Ooceraea biroi]